MAPFPLQVITLLLLIAGLYGFSISVLLKIINASHELCKPTELARQHFWKNFNKIDWEDINDSIVKFFLILLAPIVATAGSIYLGISWLCGYRRMPVTDVRIGILYQTRGSYFHWTDCLYFCEYKGRVFVFSTYFKAQYNWEDYKTCLKADIKEVVKGKFKMRGAVLQNTAEKIYRSHLNQIHKKCANFSLPS